MFRGALVLALGLFGICFAVAAQQARHSRATRHPAATSAVTLFDGVSSLSLYWPHILSASDNSILFHNGPVRPWSDGGQLASETALAQIGIAPLGLFPVAYFAPSDVGAVPTSNVRAASSPRPENLASGGRDLPNGMISSPLNQVYCTGEVGFVYGQWSGKGSGDYVGSYVWGQAGNDKFQITAGAAFENWNGNSPKFRALAVPR